MTDTRPVYLNLLKIRLPVTGIVSIAHRISGALLFLGIPFAVYVLGLSVASQQGFEHSLQLLQRPFVQVVLLIYVWAFAHHLLAGIRYLCLDLDLAVGKAGSKLTARFVLAAEILIVLGYVWGVLL